MICSNCLFSFIYREKQVMQKVNECVEKLDPSIGKKIPRENLSREYLKEYMLRNYDLYDQLYEILNT